MPFLERLQHNCTHRTVPHQDTNNKCKLFDYIVIAVQLLLIYVFAAEQHSRNARTIHNSDPMTQAPKTLRFCHENQKFAIKKSEWADFPFSSIRCDLFFNEFFFVVPVSVCCCCR